MNLVKIAKLVPAKVTSPVAVYFFFCGYEVMMSNLLGNLLGDYEVIRNKSQRLSGGIIF